MAQMYSTGPVNIFCGVGPTGNPLFLGHGERAPKIRRRRATVKAMTDHAGAIQADTAYAGQMAMVSVSLTRWNESVLTLIRDVAREPGAASFEGTDLPGDIGSLLLEEGKAYRLWLEFPNNLKAAYQRAANGILPPGYQFFAAHLDDSDDEENGYGPRKINLTWICLRALDINERNILGRGSYICYDNNMAALAGVDIN